MSLLMSLLYARIDVFLFNPEAAIGENHERSIRHVFEQS
jgi:hypothetical protein